VAPIAKVDDLAAYDAIIIGAGTRFGRLPSQMANFLDQAGGLWARGALHGKVGGAFTSSATQHGEQETTLFSIITNLLHFGMVVVGLDYGHTGQMTLDEITGGSPYGATTITGGDGSRLPTANDLEGARHQGRKIAETANKLHGRCLSPALSAQCGWQADAVCYGNGEGPGAAAHGQEPPGAMVILSRRKLLQETELFPDKSPLGPFFDPPFGDRREGGTVRNCAIPGLEGNGRVVAAAPFVVPAREADGR
jgi:NAD(P)H dehydrogenase (quinone)